VNSQLLDRAQFALRVAAWIAAERNARSMGREQLADHLRIHRNTVMVWEHGYSRTNGGGTHRAGELPDISLAHFVTLCRVFGQEPGAVLATLMKEEREEEERNNDH
jgi:DNA-binding XRE family transcriptional regulator